MNIAHEISLPSAVSDLQGIWINTNALSDSLCRVIIECDEQGVFWIEIFFQVNHKPLSRGRIVMDVHQAERQQSGFHAVYDCTDRQLHLAANYKLGVLVIETFTSFKTERDRPGYIERDFFRPLPARKMLSAVEDSVQKNSLVDLTPYAGSWVNSNKNEQSLLGFGLTVNGKNWQLQLSMAEREYRAVPVTAYLDNMGYLAFKASVALTDRQLTFAANTQKALVVMTIFVRFLPDSVHGPDKNQVYREIFLRDSFNVTSI